MITIHQRYRQTDRQTTCDGNTALCTISASRGKKKKKSSLPIGLSVTHISIIVTLAVIKVVFILHVLGLALVLYLVMQHFAARVLFKIQFSSVQFNQSIFIYSRHHSP